MSEDWKCSICGREIMSDENTHTEGGKTNHIYCEIELKKQEKEK